MINRFSLYFTKNISYINFCISLTAFTFQVGILNPCNKYLDNKFNNIDKKYDNMITKIDNMSSKINNNGTNNSTNNDKIIIASNENNKNNSIYFKNDKKISYKEY